MKILSSLQQKSAARAATWRRDVRSLRACLGTLAAARWLALATIVAVALPGTADATVYYPVFGSGTSVGADGTTNLPSGNTASGTWRTLLSTTSPTGTATSIAGAPASTAVYTLIGTAYLSANYASDTTIAANPSASLWLQSTSTTNERFQFDLVDYDPAGAAGNGTTIATLTGLASPGTTATLANITLTGASYVVPAGHRLALRVSFKPRNAGDIGQLWCNSSARNSSVTVTETAAPVPPGTPGTPTFSSIADTSLTVNWTAASGATSYKVERAPDVSGSAGTYVEVVQGVGGTSWADPGPLTASTKYWYRVRGTNAVGDGAYSAGASVTTTGAAVPPGAPGTPSFSAITQTTLTVSWTAASGATSYKVERAPDVSGSAGTYAQVASAVSGTSWPDPGPLTAATKYWYRVRGTNTAGDGAYGTGASVTTAGPVGTPGTPTFSSITSSTLTVGWTAAANATTYKIERAPDSGGSPGGWAQVASGVSATSWADPGALTAGATYWYRVRGTDAGAVDGPYSTQASVTTLVAVPGAPGTPTFSSVAQTTLTVSWSAASGAATYRVERAPDNAGVAGTYVQIASGVTGTSYPDSGLTANTKYWYRVRGTNTGGDGAYGTGASVTTLVNVPGAPGTPTFGAITQTTVSVSWSAATGSPTGYKLERAPDASGSPGSWIQIFTPATTSQADSGLIPGAKYWYRARATNAGGDGAYGATATVTMLSATTAVADGVNPSPPVTICPSGAATPIDAFTLTSTGAVDSISSVTVNLSPPGAYLNLASVEVTDDALAVKGSAAAKGNTVVVTLGSPIASPLVTTQYKLRIVPKPHSGMPAASNGQSYATTALVSAISGSNPSPTYGDTGSGIITVDNRSPSNPAWSTINTASGSVTLNWTNPSDTDLNTLAGAVIILQKSGGPITDVPGEGVTYSSGALGASTVAYASGATTPGAALSKVIATTDGVANYFKIFAKDACGNYSAGAQLGPIVTSNGTTLVEGDKTSRTQKPTISIVNPGKNTAVSSGSFKVQVRVFYPNGATIAPTTDLLLNTTGSPTTFPALPTTYVTQFARNSNYGSLASSGVFEATVSGLAEGSYTLRARATNALGSVNSAAVPIRVNPATAKGGGTLLRRDNSSQLCNDCHQLASHSSETAGAAGSKHGSWATSCGDCHSPHGTTNIYLIDNPITPPAVNGYQPPKPVFFSNKTGYSFVAGATNKTTATFANADNTGPCQACHTRTASSTGTPRFQNSGADDGHYTKEPTTVPASAFNCLSCHPHSNGFAPTGKHCKDCHLTSAIDRDDIVWNGTTATINDSDWTTYGHGRSAATSYPSGNPGADFDIQGAAAGDRGCLYCHTSSGSHGDVKNYFRLANTNRPELNPDWGPNGTCLICHDKSTDVNGVPKAVGYDPDNSPTDLTYAKIIGKADQRVPGGHGGHAANEPATGGMFCWDCHDPHGDKSQTSQALWYMLQTKLVQNSIPAGVTYPYADNWGKPNDAAGAKEYAGTYEFNAALGGTTTIIDYPDFYLPQPPAVGGVCRVCHEADSTVSPAPPGPGTRLFNQTVSVGWGTLATNHPRSPQDDSVNKKCTDCHVHKISCGGCHNAPTASGLHSQHHQVPATLQLDVDYRKTDTEADEALYGFRCAKCHNETHNNQAPDLAKGTQANPYNAAFNFDGAADPKNPAPPATYTFGGSQAAGSPYIGGSTAPTKWWGWTVGTCASIYCHSNGTPAGGVAVTYKNVTWTPGGGQGTWGCTSCHGDNVTATATMSTAHALHFATGYAYGCAKCHLSVASSNTVLNTTYVGGGKLLHVNGLKDVKFDAFQGQGGGTYDGVGRTCSATYCHSNGTQRAQTSYTSGPSIAWTTTGQPTCTACHGGDASTGTSVIAGALKGGTGAHTNHVNKSTVIGVNIGCASCHSATVSSNATISNKAAHVDGGPGVSLATITSPLGKARSGGTPTGTSPATACNSNWCHSTGQETLTPTPVTWTTTWANGVCKGCHGTTAASWAGEPDWAGTGNRHNAKHIPQSAVTAAASCVRCHATTTTTGTTILTTTPSKHLDGDRDVSFANVGGNPGGGATPYNATTKSCQAYCHSNATPYGGIATTYATVTWDQATVVGCGSCHGAKDAATTMSTPHAKHINSASGSYAFGCSQCHWGTTQADGVILAGSTKHVDGVKTDVSFNPAWPTWAPQASANYNASTHQCASTYCHGAFAGGNTATVTWSSTVTCNSCHGNPPGDSTHSSVLAGADCGGCHTGYTATTVNAGEHVNGVKSGGGGCSGCHGGVKGSRRAVIADFSLNSHHAGKGGAGSFMGAASALTDNDCLVCHAEGSASSQGAKPSVDDYNASTNPTGRHMNGVIDLRNADNNTNYFEYNSTAIIALGAGANSSNSTFKSEMSGRSDDAVGPPTVACAKPAASGYTCSKGLDRFCVNCHDANGAAAASSQGDVGATRLNPFNDVTGATAIIGNEYDQQNRGAVVDVGSRVAETGTTCTPRSNTCTSGTYAASDRDAAVRSVYLRNDPPEGVFARHAIRGLSQSVYGGTNTNWDTTTYWNRAKVTWQSSAVMACADCHTTDGANTTTGNAHGSTSEYLLKNASGGAAEPAKGAYANYYCALCHNGAWYAASVHTPNAGDFSDYTDLTGAARIPVGNTGGNVYGNACGNCHGGGPASKAGAVFPTGSAGLGGYGTIHGTSQILGIGSGGTGTGSSGLTERKAYRFMNGNSMRYYDPGDWVGTSLSRSCYTISAGDTWGGCTKHGNSGAGRSALTPAQRPLAY